MVVCTLVLAALIPGAGQAQERCEPPAARVVSVQGTVELRPAGTDAWTPAMLDDALCIGDALRVGRASRAALALANDSTLRLDQRTTVQLRGAAEEQRSLLDLILGSVYFFSHRPRALEVGTPFVNAAAEGTEFLVRVEADRAEVVMLDGRVLLRNAQGELRVASGDAALIPEGQAPRAMVVARPRDAVAWALYYPPILTDLAGGATRARPLPPGLQAAVARVADNDYPAALDALDTVPEPARDARYFTYRAGVLLNVGRTEEAAAAIERALALDPEAGEALAQRAIIHVVQNREAEALADGRRALELSPESPPAAIALSYALQAAFRLDEAREVLRTAVERSPEDALAWARLAELEQMFGALGAAQRAAERAVVLAPDLARTQMVLGFAALTRIDIDQARAAFERAIALNSANPLPRLGLGLAKIRRSDLAEGRHEIEIAAALAPNDALIRSYLGKAYFEEKRDDRANEQFAIAQDLDPLDPTAFLYEAIKQQTENRPGEALRNLQRSIELNDNRAVYRSRLLLEADRAARGTSLARIYQDLGFPQLGIYEASRSLTLDPASSSAHRFLSDVYLGGRRLDISRVSELFQAKMLQDININPVQPSLSEANISLVARGGPTAIGFNEFTPLFERQDTQLNAAGVVGSNNTYGGEGVVSMLYDRYSLSAGAFHFETDGWRPNYDVNDDIYNLFGQASIAPGLNAQVEVRHRNLDQGDLAFDFDPDDFSESLRRDLKEDTARVGLRYSPSPQSDFLLSVIYNDRSERRRETEDFFAEDDLFTDFQSDNEGYQTEGQHVWRMDRFNVISGFGFSDVERHIDLLIDIEGLPPDRESLHPDITHPRGYVYGNLRAPAPVLWTLGISYDYFNESEEELEISQPNPKFGVQWNVTDEIRLRAAAFRVVKPALVNNRTLEPTQIGGFNQFFDDLNATKSWRYGVGLDWRPTSSLFAGTEFSWRDLDEPVSDDGSTKFEKRNEQLYRGYLYWTPLPQLALSAELIYDRYHAEQGLATTFDGLPRKVETLSVPVVARYFHPSGWFAGVGGTYVDQQVRRANFESDDFLVVDVLAGYRFPNRLGVASVQVNNLFDTGLHYQDDSFREFRDDPSISRYIPERTVLGRITINF